MLNPKKTSPRFPCVSVINPPLKHWVGVGKEKLKSHKVKKTAKFQDHKTFRLFEIQIL